MATSSFSPVKAAVAEIHRPAERTGPGTARQTDLDKAVHKVAEPVVAVRRAAGGVAARTAAEAAGIWLVRVLRGGLCHGRSFTWDCSRITR